MRAKTKKWFSPLFVLTLAVAGIFGVSAAVVDKQAEDAPTFRSDASLINYYVRAYSNNDFGYDDDHRFETKASNAGWIHGIELTAGDAFKCASSSWSNALGHSKIYNSCGAYSNFGRAVVADRMWIVDGTNWDNANVVSMQDDNIIRLPSATNHYLSYSDDNMKIPVYLKVSNTNWIKDNSSFCIVYYNDPDTRYNGSLFIGTTGKIDQIWKFEIELNKLNKGFKFARCPSSGTNFYNPSKSVYDYHGNDAKNLFKYYDDNIYVKTTSRYDIWATTSYAGLSIETATYGITYEKNGGTINTGNVVSYTYGTSTTLPSDVTKSGSAFGGWYDNPSFTGSPVTSIGTSDYGDKKYYAKWNPVPAAGVYLVGTFNNWVVDSSCKSTEASEPYSFPIDITVANDEETVEFQIRRYNGSSATPTNYYYNPSTGTAVTNVTYDMGNQKAFLTGAGTYSVELLSTGYIRVDKSADKDFSTSGYYLVGNSTFETSIGKSTGTPWTFTGGLSMDTDVIGMGDNTAVALGVQLTNGSTFRAESFLNNVNAWITTSSTIPSGTSSRISKVGDNLVVGTTGKFDFFINNSVLYVDDSYTLTYKYVVDGVVQDRKPNAANTAAVALSDGTVTVGAGHRFADLSDPSAPGSISGVSFGGWYSDAACTTEYSLAGTHIIKDYSSGELYAKFTSNNTSKSLFLGIKGMTDSSKNDNADLVFGNRAAWDTSATNYTYIWYSVGSDAACTYGIKVKEYRAISVTGWKFFSFKLPSNAVRVVVHNGDTNVWNDKKNQTINLSLGSGQDDTKYANDNNMYAIPDPSVHGTNYLRKGKWTDFVYSLEVCNNTSFSSGVVTYNMNTPSDPFGQNTCEIMSVSIPQNYYVRGRYVSTLQGAGIEGTYSTRGGDDGDSAYTQQASGSVKLLSAKTVNIYITNAGALFFVDCDGKAAAGYLYISSDILPSQMKIYSTVTPSGEAAIKKYIGDKVSSVTDMEYSTSLTYDSVKGMIKIPLYELKGSKPLSTDTFEVILTNNNDTKETSITNITIPASGTNIYHITLTATGSWSAETSATAHNSDYTTSAELAFQVDRLLSSLEDQSICNCNKTSADGIVLSYKALSDNAKTKFNDSEIETWTSSAMTSKTDWSMQFIYAQIQAISSTGKPMGANSISSFDPYSLISGENGNDASVILIIVASSISILSITALSVLMVKKKKSANK